MMSRGSISLKLAEDLGNDVDHFLLLFIVEAIGHVLDDGIEGRDGGRTEVEDHDDLALGQLVGTQPLEEPGDALRAVGDWYLAQGTRRALQILQQLHAIAGQL